MPAGEPPINRDGLKIEAPETAPISNIVIDHCTFTWSTDEIASAWQYWNNISLLNNIFAEPLHDSIHPEGKHGFGVLIGPVNGNATRRRQPVHEHAVAQSDDGGDAHRDRQQCGL